MVDKMPNYEVEIKRLEVEISTMKHNLLRNELKVMELDAEKKRIAENDEATKKNIKELEIKLVRLRKTHEVKDV